MKEIWLAYSLNSEQIDLIYESDKKSIIKKVLDLYTQKEENYLKITNNVRVIYPKVFIKKDICHYIILLTKKYAWLYERELLKFNYFVDYENYLITSNIGKMVNNKEKYINYIKENLKSFEIMINNIHIDLYGYLFIKVDHNKKHEIEEVLESEEFIYTKIRNKDDIENISTNGEYIKIYRSENYVSYSMEENKEIYAKIKINK